MLSDNCHSNLPPPTEQGFCAWLAIAQQRLDRLAHTPATSLGDLEIAVVEELHRLGASLLTQAANRQAQATAFLCSRCQQPLAREAKNHVRKIDSLVGPLQLRRDYGPLAGLAVLQRSGISGGGRTSRSGAALA